MLWFFVPLNFAHVFLFFQSVRTVLGRGFPVLLCVVASDSTLVYQRMTDGFVTPDPPAGQIQDQGRRQHRKRRQQHWPTDRQTAESCNLLQSWFGNHGNDPWYGRCVLSSPGWHNYGQLWRRLEWSCYKIQTENTSCAYGRVDVHFPCFLLLACWLHLWDYFERIRELFIVHGLSHHCFRRMTLVVLLWFNSLFKLNPNVMALNTFIFTKKKRNKSNILTKTFTVALFWWEKYRNETKKMQLMCIFALQTDTG